jgi:hypothetical protein
MPEQQNIEYKQSWHDDYLKWVCRFANAIGGQVGGQVGGKMSSFLHQKQDKLKMSSFYANKLDKITIFAL